MELGSQSVVVLYGRRGKLDKTIKPIAQFLEVCNRMMRLLITKVSVVIFMPEVVD